MANRLRKTVQILGKGRGVEPPSSPGIERWGINDLAFVRYSGEFTAWTRWFDMHPPDRIRARRPQAWEWYQQQDKPIYLLEANPDIPASVEYPKKRILSRFATTRFQSSFDWAMALALEEQFEQIELVWCPMKQPSEHDRQIPSACYWIGRAEERGVEVVIHGESALQAATQLYGYDYPLS